MKEPIRLLVDSESGSFLPRVRKNPAAAPFEILSYEERGREALFSLAPRAEAMLWYKAPLPGDLIRAAGSLRLIQKHGLNLKNIDVAAATERRVPVAAISLFRNASVAEQALALMLACARKVIPGHNATAGAAYLEMGIEPVRTDQWKFQGNWANIPGVTELCGAKAGILGLGDIGMEVAKRCRAFEMEILYHQRNRHPKSVESKYGAAYLPFGEFLAEADYLILVLPHTPETEGIIGGAELARMKPTATLINVARGGVVDEDALALALQEGQIAMAGLDVYREEPLPASSPLRGLPNAVLLPHTGGGSCRSWEVDLPAVLGNILRFFRGEKLSGAVNAPFD